MSRCGDPPALQILLLLLLAAPLFPVRDATPDEGTALVAMMQHWGVQFDGWGSGGDPCTLPIWKYVNCTAGHVVYLNVTNTAITGSIPSEIGALTRLEVLDISNLYNGHGPKNFLSGNFPDSLAQCTNLSAFNASNIAWNMSFPLVITKLTALRDLRISSAGLFGIIPDDFYNNLINMWSLWLGGNTLTGSIPKLLNFKNLAFVSLYENDLTGTIPEELGTTLTQLQFINFHSTNLYGPLPDSFSQLKYVQNISLFGNTLTGQIPDSWRAMTSIRSLRLQQNYLTGPIPSWMFTEWVNLNYVFLSSNRFSGPAPNFAQLDLQRNISYNFYNLRWDCNYLNGSQPCLDTYCSAETLTKVNSADNFFDFENNCYENASQTELDTTTICHTPSLSCSSFYLLTCPPCPMKQIPWPLAGTCVCQLAGKDDSHGVPVYGVVGGLVGLAVVFLVLLALILYKRRKQFKFLDIFNARWGPKEDEYWEAPPGVERFTKEDLARATQDFSDTNMIGQGGFGRVFVGTLDDGRMVAIKRANAGGLQGTLEFRNEVGLLSRLHHRNLVKLEGFCDEDGLQILVYEFMTKGNLHAHLLGQLTNTPLHWYQRLEIAYGVAQGLEYLHSFADPPVIHRDVKPSNILLDDNMVAKLSDFGISKVSPEYDTHVSTRPAGTAGYLDPDYFMRRQLTSASDVYAFGVVMLELVTGQEAIDHKRLEEFNLIAWVSKRFRTAGVVAIVDPLIEHDYYSPRAFTEMTKLGLRCASFNRDERPSMKTCLATLEPLLMTTVDSQTGRKSQKSIRVSFQSPERPEHTKLLDDSGRSTTFGETDIELMSRGPRPR